MWRDVCLILKPRFNQPFTGMDRQIQTVNYLLKCYKLQSPCYKLKLRHSSIIKLNVYIIMFKPVNLALSKFSESGKGAEQTGFIIKSELIGHLSFCSHLGSFWMLSTDGDRPRVASGASAGPDLL